MCVCDRVPIFRSFFFQCTLSAGSRDGIHQSVTADVISVLRSKSTRQLQTMRDEIEEKLKSGKKGIDVGYWESLLQQLKGTYVNSLYGIYNLESFQVHLSPLVDAGRARNFINF